MELTKDQVLYLASTSPEAKIYLKQIFPQYFETYFVFSDIVAIDNEPRTLAARSGFGLSPMVWVSRTADEETNKKSLVLAEGFEWEIFTLAGSPQQYLRAKIK